MYLRKVNWVDSLLIALYLLGGMAITYFYAVISLGLFHGTLNIIKISVLCFLLSIIAYFICGQRGWVKMFLNRWIKYIESSYKFDKQQVLDSNYEIKLSVFLFMALFGALLFFAFFFEVLDYRITLWVFVSIAITCLIAGANIYPCYVPDKKNGRRELLITSRIYTRIMSNAIILFIGGTILVYYNPGYFINIFAQNYPKQFIEASIKSSKLDSAYYQDESSTFQMEPSKFTNEKPQNQMQLKNKITAFSAFFPFVIFSYWLLGLILGAWAPLFKVTNLLTILYERQKPETVDVRNIYNHPTYVQKIDNENWAELIKQLECCAESHSTELIAIYDKLITINPEVQDLRIAKARVLIAIKKNNEALEILDKILKDSNNQNPEALFEKSLIYSNMAYAEGKNGKKDAEEEMLNQALQNAEEANTLYNNEDPRILISLGYTNWRLGNYRKAIFLTKAAENRPVLTKRQAKIIVNNLAYYYSETILNYNDTGYECEVEKYRIKIKEQIDDNNANIIELAKEYDNLGYSIYAIAKLTSRDDKLLEAYLYFKKAYKLDPHNDFIIKHIDLCKKIDPEIESRANESLQS